MGRQVKIRAVSTGGVTGEGLPVKVPDHATKLKEGRRQPRRHRAFSPFDSGIDHGEKKAEVRTGGAVQPPESGD